MNFIGIIVAMDEECEEIQRLMTNIQTKQIYNLNFIIGKINEKNCILTKSGVGKVNAARTIQIMIDNFDLDMVINVGAAGAINYLLNIGDVVIANHVLQHDFDITAFGHSKGYITGVGDKIYCDKNLVTEFENLIKNSEERIYNIKTGIVASGDIFCTEVTMKDKINAKFNADVVDMECASVAQVCYLDNIPFASVRCISDIPNGSNDKTFDENLKLASKRCAKILYEFCKNKDNNIN